VLCILDGNVIFFEVISHSELKIYKKINKKIGGEAKRMGMIGDLERDLIQHLKEEPKIEVIGEVGHLEV